MPVRCRTCAAQFVVASAHSYNEVGYPPLCGGQCTGQHGYLHVCGGHMQSNGRIIGAVLAGVGSLLLAYYVQSVVTQRKRAAKELARNAVRAWEGEGGALIDAAPRANAG